MKTEKSMISVTIQLLFHITSFIAKQIKLVLSSKQRAKPKTSAQKEGAK
jgi:hypothetical protein